MTMLCLPSSLDDLEDRSLPDLLADFSGIGDRVPGFWVPRDVAYSYGPAGEVDLIRLNETDRFCILVEYEPRFLDEVHETQAGGVNTTIIVSKATGFAALLGAGGSAPPSWLDQRDGRDGSLVSSSGVRRWMRDAFDQIDSVDFATGRQLKFVTTTDYYPVDICSAARMQPMTVTGNQMLWRRRTDRPVVAF